MPKTEEQYKDIRNDRINEIKNAALKLFADYGYHSTSISKIAQKVNISKGLMYNYFDSKEQLLSEIIKDFVNLSYEHFDLNKDGVLTDEEFFYFIEKTFDTIEQNPAHWKLYLSISFQPYVTDFILKNASNFAGNVQEILFNFFQKKCEKDTMSEILFFSSLLKGVIIQYVSSPTGFPLEEMKLKMINFYKHKFQNIEK